MHACNENELYELSLSLSKDNYSIMDVPLALKYYSTDDVASVNHYISETDKWIENNYESIKDFCIKLMVNKGFDTTNIENNYKTFEQTKCNITENNDGPIDQTKFNVDNCELIIKCTEKINNGIQNEIILSTELSTDEVYYKIQ
jgi:hypothetical protein